MTLAESIQYLPPVPGTLTLDTVVAAIGELVDSPPSEIVQSLAVINGHLQASRKSGYVPQHITDEAVVRVMSTLLTKSGRKAYILSMINGLLLNRDRGEQALDCKDWTVFGDQSIAVYVTLDRVWM